MRHNFSKNFVASIVGSLLVACCFFVGDKAEVMPVNPNASLPGIVPAGYKSFTFNDDKDSFGNRVQSWFANYLTVRPTGSGFAFDGNLLGFTIDNITRAVEIVGCKLGAKSIYFYIDENFPGVPAPGNSIYRTQMAAKTTIPVPPAV